MPAAPSFAPPNYSLNSLSSADTPNFSFEKDVAPYASKFFDKIGGTENLTEQARARLQGSLLGGMEGIQNQRLKLQEERDQGRMRSLQYATGVEALEDARAKRVRVEQQQAQVGGFHSAINDIANSDLDGRSKQQQISALAIANADVIATNPDVKNVFDIASKALNPEKSTITPAERLSAAMGGVSQEALDRAAAGDYSQVSFETGQLKEAKEAKAEAKRTATATTTEQKATSRRLAFEPIEFERDENKVETPWLKPESTQRAAAVVYSMGTPAEQAAFEKLKDASSDKDRASMAKEIQLRYLREIAQGGAEDPLSKTGLPPIRK